MKDFQKDSRRTVIVAFVVFAVLLVMLVLSSGGNEKRQAITPTSPGVEGWVAPSIVTRVQPEFGSIRRGSDNPVPAFEWRIRTQLEIRLLYKRAGKRLHDGQKLEAFTAVEDGKFVVYTVAPKYVDDQATKSFGHEVMHLALGNYHPQVEAK